MEAFLETVRGYAYLYDKSSVGQGAARQPLAHYGQQLGMTERRFSEKHEWVIMDGDIGTVGISQHAQEALGDVVYVQPPDIGMELAQHDECGAIESVKAASEIYTPVSGKVTEVNKALEDKPALVNSDCYNEGWIFKLKVKNTDELKSLMDEEAYQEFLKSSA